MRLARRRVSGDPCDRRTREVSDCYHDALLITRQSLDDLKVLLIYGLTSETPR